MAVIETFHGLLNHAAKKGVSEVPIKSSKAAYLRSGGLLEMGDMNLKDIFMARPCSVG